MSLTVAALIGSITVFILAIFLGFELISKVPPTLHTPLMSGANAISGITIVGALILSNTAFNDGNPGTAAWLAFAAACPACCAHWSATVAAVACQVPIDKVASVPERP